jgi:hypothetical protein
VAVDRRCWHSAGTTATVGGYWLAGDHDGRSGLWRRIDGMARKCSSHGDIGGLLQRRAGLHRAVRCHHQKFGMVCQDARAEQQYKGKRFQFDSP